MSPKKHLHIYKRINLAGNKKEPYYVYACQKSDCHHYIHLSLIEGRAAECPRCNGEFTIEAKHLSLVSPHCDNCTTRRHDTVRAEID
jgi:uncharacterized paraquat-inducible protein A